MCLFDGWGVPRLPDPGKITTKNDDPHKVPCGKSGSWGWKVRGQVYEPCFLSAGQDKSGRALDYIPDSSQTLVLTAYSELWDAVGKEAPYAQGTPERGGMRLYLVSHLAGGRSNPGPQPTATRWPRGKTGSQRFPALCFQLNQYVPHGSINAVCR